MADSNRLIQVIYNLLSNAIGFSPEDGTITLNCRREKNGVAISVQDNGLGIPEEEQATMFDRFESRSKGSRHGRRVGAVAREKHRAASQGAHRSSLHARRRNHRYSLSARPPPSIAAEGQARLGEGGAQSDRCPVLNQCH